ncbi:MAG: hypothetical protein GX803_07335 [Lentisphaerae bacterium]|jgi:uncharacterized protein YgiM (DUF1202 family)|nr:hypothetical protein [Lentisphaerota bacterium]
MKWKTLTLTCLAFCSVLAVAHGESRMQVTAASALVYSQPSISAQQLGRAAHGEILFVTRTENEWTAIQPPDHIDLWLNKDFIENNRVIARSIQVLSGPGIQHDTVGQLQRGAPVMPRGEQGDWARIAPPSTVTLWVRTADLAPVKARTETAIRDVAAVPEPVAVAPPPPPEPEPAPTVAPEPPPPAKPKPKPAQVAATSPPKPKPVPAPAPSPAPAPAARPVRPITPARTTAPSPAPATVPRAAPTLRPATAVPQPAGRPAPRPTETRPVQPAREPVAAVPTPQNTVSAHRSPHVEVSVDPALVEDLDLIDAPNQGVAVQVEGELRAAPFLAASPSRYRLLNREGRILEMVCHIHGDSTELRRYIGKKISIRGRQYWVEQNDMPVVVVGQIVPLAPEPVDEPVLF